MIHAGCILFLLSHISLAKSCYGLGTLPFIFGNCSPTIDFKWELLWYFTVCYFRVLASLKQSSSIWKRGVYMNQWYSSAASALERHKNEWNAVTETRSPRMLCQICTSDIRRNTFQVQAAEQTGSYNFTPQFLHFHFHLWRLEHVKVWVSSPKVAWCVFHLLFKKKNKTVGFLLPCSFLLPSSRKCRCFFSLDSGGRLLFVKEATEQTVPNHLNTKQLAHAALGSLRGILCRRRTCFLLWVCPVHQLG